MTSDFIAKFQGISLPNPEVSIHNLSTIINELIENAIKFSANEDETIEVKIHHIDNTIEIQTTNICQEKAALNLQKQIKKITSSSNPESLLTSQLLKSASQSSSQSGIGLLSLVCHYGAKLTSEITPCAKAYAKAYKVSLSAQIKTAQLSK
jgi:hypothetical protein